MIGEGAWEIVFVIDMMKSGGEESIQVGGAGLR